MRRSLLLLVAFMTALATPLVASAAPAPATGPVVSGVPRVSPVMRPEWYDDGFDGTSSGQAVYEDMMIHPQSVRGPDGRVYVVYQGPGLDPYAIVAEPDGSWDGPVKIGENPLATGRNPDDTHGAPSLLIDDEGYLHVFFGSHVSRLNHAVSAAPLDISAWRLGQGVPPHAATYPQPTRDASGTVHLYYRLDQDGGTYHRGSWMQATYSDDVTRCVSTKAVVAGDDAITWYAHTEQGFKGRQHTVVLTCGRSGDPFDRRGVYYIYADGDGVWRDVRGTPVASERPDLGITISDLTSTAVSCTVYDQPGEQQNQVTVADDGTGRPLLLFNTGSGYGPDSHRWVFARWDGSAWSTKTVAPTDHIFDSSTLEMLDGGIDAFLTVGGTTGWAIDEENYVDRGGDLVHYRSSDMGTTWSKEATLAAADRARGRCFNDPQVVVGHDGDPRLLFGEWNNDGGNFVHRVFLWGDRGYRQREFFPELMRLGGGNRYAVAANASRQTFPNGCDRVLIVSGTSYADALAAVPLAYLYDSSLLLVSRDVLPGATIAEIKRLKATSAVVIGGTGSVSDGVYNKLRNTGTVKSVRRIGGADRYTVAANIAKEMAVTRGAPATAFVVNGDAWADALAVAPIAAQHRSPVLLVRTNDVPAVTRSALGVIKRGGKPVVAGGEMSVSPTTAASIGATIRLGGLTRYEVAENVARFALDGSGTLPPVAEMRRFSVTAGHTFADAIAAGVLVARGHGVLLLTPSAAFEPSTRALLDERVRQVLLATIAGGESSVSRAVADDLATMLAEHQYD